MNESGCQIFHSYGELHFLMSFLITLNLHRSPWTYDKSKSNPQHIWKLIYILHWWKQSVIYHFLNVIAKKHTLCLQFTVWLHIELRWGKEGEFPENWLQLFILFHAEHNFQCSKFNFLPQCFYPPQICTFPLDMVR